MVEATDESASQAVGQVTSEQPATAQSRSGSSQRGKTVHGSPANAGHRVLAPDDAEVEAYLEVALDAPAPDRDRHDHPATSTDQPTGTVAILDFGSQFAQLIARRVRELNVYSELLPFDTSMAELERRGRPRHHPVGRSQLRVRRGRAASRQRHLERPHPGPGHLLRRPADGRRTGR